MAIRSLQLSLIDLKPTQAGSVIIEIPSESTMLRIDQGHCSQAQKSLSANSLTFELDIPSTVDLVQVAAP